MSDLPRFATLPFRKNESSSPESSPPVSPMTWSMPPKRAAKQKRPSLTPLTGDYDRKPSVAPFHGDLVKEHTTKNRRKLWVKVLAYFTVFLAGAMAGIAIGHWAIPMALSTSEVSTASETSAAAVLDASDTEAKKVKGKVGSNLPVSQQKQQTTKAATAKATSSAKVSGAATTSSAPKATSNSAASSTVSSAYWQPTSGIKFQIQLNSVISSTSNLPSDIAVYETDLFDTPVATITALKAAGKKVVCYFSGGTAENWRSDYSQFKASDLGADMAGWAGEKWVDTTSTNVRNIMLTRIALAKTKGCDAVDPDNVDVYSYGTKSGFSKLTQAAAIDYTTFLADHAHGSGMAIGLKNAGEILATVQPVFDFSISESCVQYNECNIYQPFINAGKPAFNIQYPFGSSGTGTTVTTAIVKKYCTGTSNLTGFTILLKHNSLDSWIYQC